MDFQEPQLTLKDFPWTGLEIFCQEPRTFQDFQGLWESLQTVEALNCHQT